MAKLNNLLIRTNFVFNVLHVTQKSLIVSQLSLAEVKGSVFIKLEKPRVLAAVIKRSPHSKNEVSYANPRIRLQAVLAKRQMSSQERNGWRVKAAPLLSMLPNGMYPTKHQLLCNFKYQLNPKKEMAAVSERCIAFFMLQNGMYPTKYQLLCNFSKKKFKTREFHVSIIVEFLLCPILLHLFIQIL